MKKILCLFLILCIIPLNTAYAFFYEDIEECSFPESIEIMDLLGIMEGYDDEVTFNPEKEVTRGEFSEIIMRILDPSQPAEKGYFMDVPKEHPNYNSINSVAQMGYMTGYENNIFKPDERITIGEVLAVAVKLSGYKYLADANGGYPTGYLLAANQLGILKGISISMANYATRDVVAKIIDNLLDVEVREIVGISGENNIYSSDGTTVMMKYFNLKREEGLAVADEFSAIKNSSLASENQIIIDYVNYYIDISFVSNIVGKNVRYIYRMDKETNKNYIIYIKETDNKMVSVRTEKYISFTNNNLSYYDENDNIKSIYVSKHASYIVNGETKKYFEGIFDSVIYGEFTLISTANNSEYDIVHIDSVTKNIRVGNVSEDDYILTDKNDYTKKIIADSRDMKVSIYDCDNDKEISFSEIRENSVVTEMKSDNITSLFVTAKTVNGWIEQADYSENKIIISGAEYEYNSLCETSYIAKFRPGDNVTLYLDYMGKIAFAEHQKTSDGEYAYLINTVTRIIENEDVIYGKFYTSSGEMKSFKFSDKLKVNGTRREYSGEEDLLKLIGTFDTLSQTYKLEKMTYITVNDDTVISIAVEGSSSDVKTIEEKWPVKERTYISNYGCFNYDMYIASGTPIFAIPDNPLTADERQFGILNTDDFISLDEYTVSGYVSNPDGEEAEAVIVKGMSGTGGTVPAKTALCVVTKVTEVISDNGENLKRIRFVQSGNESYVDYDELDNVTYTYNDVAYTPSQLQAGDVITYTVNVSGLLKNFSVYYKSGIFTAADNSESFGAADRIFVREVSSVTDKFITLSSDGVADQKYLTSGSYKYAKVEKVGNSYRVSTADVSDIEVEDIIIAQVISRTMTNMVIIKK